MGSRLSRKPSGVARASVLPSRAPSERSDVCAASSAWRGGGSGKGKLATRAMPMALSASTTPSTGTQLISDSANCGSTLVKTDDE
eukprot:scaffold49686_cov44-Phaeocystis_antarctica.AAC.1